MSLNIEILSRAANEARGLCMDAVQASKSGHLGLPLGCAEMGAVLYGYALKHNPDKPRWIGRQEESINMAHIASVRIDTRLVLSDVYIETSGGSDPIVCHGHRKGDAVAMKNLLDSYQTEYYRGGPPRPVGGGDSSR